MTQDTALTFQNRKFDQQQKQSDSNQILVLLVVILKDGRGQLFFLYFIDLFDNLLKTNAPICRADVGSTC